MADNEQVQTYDFISFQNLLTRSVVKDGTKLIQSITAAQAAATQSTDKAEVAEMQKLLKQTLHYMLEKLNKTVS